MRNIAPKPKPGRPPSAATLPTLFNELAQRLHVPNLEISVPRRAVPKRLDGILQIGWQGHCQPYAYQYVTSSTPKAVHTGLLHLQAETTTLDLHPLLIAPYLSEERLHELESRSISGLDLCGNCMLVGQRFSIWRSGNPNHFSESRPLKNVFRGKSSLYSRCFVLRPEFPSLTALRDFAQQRLSQPYRPAGDDLHLTLATASKVVHALEEHLLIAKEQRALHLLDLHGLMDLLLKEYRPPEGRRLRGKPAHPDALFNFGRRARFCSVHTGLASAAHHGVLSPPDLRSVYVSDLAAAAHAVALKETDVFPTLELVEEPSELVYFDGRRRGHEIWASPVQTWLELANAGPRERDAAQTIEKALRSGQLQEA